MPSGGPSTNDRSRTVSGGPSVESRASAEPSAEIALATTTAGIDPGADLLARQKLGAMRTSALTKIRGPRRISRTSFSPGLGTEQRLTSIGRPRRVAPGAEASSSGHRSQSKGSPEQNPRALSEGSQALLQAKREHTQPSASLTADISSSGSIGFSKSAALRRLAAKRRSSVTRRPVTNKAGVGMPLTRS